MTTESKTKEPTEAALAKMSKAALVKIIMNTRKANKTNHAELISKLELEKTKANDLSVLFAEYADKTKITFGKLELAHKLECQKLMEEIGEELCKQDNLQFELNKLRQLIEGINVLTAQ